MFNTDIRIFHTKSSLNYNYWYRGNICKSAAEFKSKAANRGYNNLKSKGYSSKTISRYYAKYGLKSGEIHMRLINITKCVVLKEKRMYFIYKYKVFINPENIKPTEDYGFVFQKKYLMSNDQIASIICNGSNMFTRDSDNL